MPLTLKRGERLLLERKRRGENQTQAATRYNVPPKLYGLWERGQVDIPFLNLRKLKMEPHERCLIKRRREKLTQGAVARQMGCSRWWLNRMEQGRAPVEALMDYWSD